MEFPKYRCEVCGNIGRVGRCCGKESQIPVNMQAAIEVINDLRRQLAMANGKLCRIGREFNYINIE